MDLATFNGMNDDVMIDNPTFLTRRRCIAGIALPIITAAWLPSIARADDYPDRPIRVIVPYSAGGSSDAPMRVIAEELSHRLGQQVVVENRAGSGAMIGTEAVVRAAPDGYTLLLSSNPQVISATLYPRLTFNPVEDLAPITMLSREPSVLVVNPTFAARTLPEFIAYVKARPDQIDYASSGNGSAQHLFTARFMSLAGLRMTHIPYRGSAQATSDLLGG
jgi:tripartite-type tricarboxylate transporter receptor subunit TctC